MTIKKVIGFCILAALAALLILGIIWKISEEGWMPLVLVILISAVLYGIFILAIKMIDP